MSAMPRTGSTSSMERWHYKEKWRYQQDDKHETRTYSEKWEYQQYCDCEKNAALRRGVGVPAVRGIREGRR